MEFRRYFRNRRRFGNGNIFRWRRRLIFRLQLRFYGRCWNIRKVDHGRLVFNRRDAHRGQMDCNCTTKSSPGLPARRRSIKKWPSHDLFSRSRARHALERFTLNFEGDLVKANRPQDVENADNVEVHRVSVAADKYLRFRILVMHFF